MGVEQSRLRTRKHQPVLKRMSLPSQLLNQPSKVTGATDEMNNNNVPGGSLSVPDTSTTGSVGYFSKDDRFSEFEQDVLLSTWPLIASDLYTHGCMVFKNALHLFPDLAKFIPFTKLSNEEIAADTRSKQHILAFMDVLSKAIGALDGSREDFCEKLMVLGARHAAVPGMKLEYFKVFKQAILMTWEALMYEEFTEDVRRAWAHLMDYIIGILSEGCLVFEEEEEKMLLDDSSEIQHRASDSQLGAYPSTRRRSGRPSVISMTPEELSHFYSVCK
ncbi:hypothetical protein CSKR_100766 [Clonorchis sinensis]|uniref:Uncharacterized protein n=2 Tax=Clonorchis sinensis TaxID=79923 RepID=A0A8T1M5I3_CLOSI|nr:hypothetical protein CSKR_100766 [Clonorchis sinensis]GAA51754.1 neuroglobin [Clonorchis sinensis]